MQRSQSMSRGWGRQAGKAREFPLGPCGQSSTRTVVRAANPGPCTRTGRVILNRGCSGRGALGCNRVIQSRPKSPGNLNGLSGMSADNSVHPTQSPFYWVINFWTSCFAFEMRRSNLSPYCGFIHIFYQGFNLGQMVQQSIPEFWEILRYGLCFQTPV